MSANALCSRLGRSFSAHADRPAIVVEPDGRVTTYRELEAMVATSRGQLQRLGFGPGTVVPLFADKSAESIALSLAAVFEGAAFAWLNTRMRPPQLRRLMQQTGAPGLFVDPANAATLHTATPDELASCRAIVLGEETAAEPRSGEAVTDAACVLFTSGSTGEPKGVLIAAEDLVRRADTEIACFGLTADDRLLCVLPLSFDVGLNQLLSALLVGASLHVSAAWLRRDIVAIVQRAQITGISAVPSIWANALSGLPAGEHILGSTPALRYVTVSGGSLPPPVFETVTQRLEPHVAIHRTYGQSETFRTAIFLRANAPEHRERRGSVGTAVPGTQILVASDRDTLAPVGVVGEVVHAGDGIMLGYLGDPALTAQKVGRHAATGDAPVIYTGDYGHLDADGYLHLAGRSDSMIKTMGFRVYPGEVEEVVAQFPGVVEAFVFGVPDPSTQEKLVVVFVADASVDLARLRAFCTSKLPSYMVPRNFARWDEVPRTSSGKPALAEIKRLFLAGSVSATT